MQYRIQAVPLNLKSEVVCVGVPADSELVRAIWDQHVKGWSLIFLWAVREDDRWEEWKFMTRDAQDPPFEVPERMESIAFTGKMNTKVLFCAKPRRSSKKMTKAEADSLVHDVLHGPPGELRVPPVKASLRQQNRLMNDAIEEGLTSADATTRQKMAEALAEYVTARARDEGLDVPIGHTYVFGGKEILVFVHGQPIRRDMLAKAKSHYADLREIAWAAVMVRPATVKYEEMPAAASPGECCRCKSVLLGSGRCPNHRCVYSEMRQPEELVSTPSKTPNKFVEHWADAVHGLLEGELAAKPAVGSVNSKEELEREFGQPRSDSPLAQFVKAGLAEDRLPNFGMPDPIPNDRLQAGDGVTVTPVEDGRVRVTAGAEPSRSMRKDRDIHVELLLKRLTHQPDYDAEQTVQELFRLYKVEPPKRPEKRIGEDEDAGRWEDAKLWLELKKALPEGFTEPIKLHVYFVDIQEQPWTVNLLANGTSGAHATATGNTVLQAALNAASLLKEEE